jgi:hypothetical protein
MQLRQKGLEGPIVIITETIDDRKAPAYLLKPLPTQSRRDLVCLAFMLATHDRLRPELRRDGVDDAEVVRQALRAKEWEVR